VLSFEEKMFEKRRSRWSWLRLLLAPNGCEMRTRIVSVSEKKLTLLPEKVVYALNGL